MRRFLGNLRWSVRWRMLLMGVFVAYCLPALCIAVLVVRAPGRAASAPTTTVTLTPTDAPELTDTPGVGPTATTTNAPDSTLTPTETPSQINDPGWDYRQSIDLRAELCARLRVPLRTEAYAALCAIRLPLSENTSAPIVDYLGTTFRTGETSRVDVDTLLGAYAAGDGIYLLPVRAENGRTVNVRLVFAFDAASMYISFEDAGEE